jgi:hypothetical protein
MEVSVMTAISRSIALNRPASMRRLRRAAPLLATLLVWLFAATMETGYVAILDSGIAHADPSRDLA